MVKESLYPQIANDKSRVDSSPDFASTNNHQKTVDDTYMQQAKLRQLDISTSLLPIDGLVINGQSESTPSMESHMIGYYRLTDEDLRFVTDLRDRLKYLLHPKYDTDFNLYRWIRSADRTSKQHGNVDLAEKLLRNHLRFRRAMKLDEIDIPTWEENPMFAMKYLPKGSLYYMASNNKFLWWVDYSSIDMGGIINTTSSTSMLVWHFWKLEHMLRLVNERELKTGALSGIHMVMDVKDYDMNPFSLVFTANGDLAYYAQLIHYEHYPELSCPVNIINVAKWLMLPYRLIRPMMPKDFNERVRISDTNYTDTLLKDIANIDLPTALGGKNECRELETVRAEKLDQSGYYCNGNHQEPAQESITQIQIGARKRKLIPVDCQAGVKLRWWFRTDADVYFGVYFMQQQSNGDSEKKLLKKKDTRKGGDVLDTMDMVHPLFRLVGKVVPEKGEIECHKTGTYYLVFCNRGSWVYRRNVQLKIEIDENVYDRKRVLERAMSVQ